jgi:Holliday junction DNA helicase RuvA
LTPKKKKREIKRNKRLHYSIFAQKSTGYYIWMFLYLKILIKMIAHLQGRLVEKNPTEVIIDCNGVGYHVNISLHTFSLLPTSDAIKLYTYLQIKEDSHTLFGFMEKSEREIFKLLLSVSGIGANIARTMLSSLEPKQIIHAIASADVMTIQTIKGIGSKTAQRVILDLKEKVLKLYDLDEVSTGQCNTNKEEEHIKTTKE